MTITLDYGLWGLVIINTAIFLIFAFSFTHPKTKKDWRSFGAFSAFIPHRGSQKSEDML